MAMNSNVLAFSEPREASHVAVNTKAFSEVNNDSERAAFAKIPGRRSGRRHCFVYNYSGTPQGTNSSSKKTFDMVMCFPLRSCIV
jgi:hypothetical protein